MRLPYHTLGFQYDLERDCTHCTFSRPKSSAIATSLHSFTASDLAQVDIHTWLELRSQLQKHHKARIEQYRFRRDPKAYLANLESRLL
jgi:competence transcription factor ComK